MPAGAPPTTSAGMVRGFLILLTAQFLGETLSVSLALPVPGPVMGLGLLLTVLVLWPQGARHVEPAAAPMLGKLSLLYLPASAGVFFLSDELARDGVALVLGAALSTVLTLVLIGVLTERLFTQRGSS